MGIFAKSEIVLVKFPFSDLTENKFRPALVLFGTDREDYVLAQITSKEYSDIEAIPISAGDFTAGNLATKSYIRPFKLFTANTSIVESRIAVLSADKYSEVVGKLKTKLMTD